MISVTSEAAGSLGSASAFSAAWLRLVPPDVSTTFLGDKLRDSRILVIVMDDAGTAYNDEVTISSVKSMLGHTMGAASAIEAVVCALAVAGDRVPPTMGLEEPEGDLDYVPNVARRLPVVVAMNNAYAFGGANASTLFRKWDAAGAAG